MESIHLTHGKLLLHTGDFMKKVPQLPDCTRDRYIVSIERVYTPNTFYMKSAVQFLNNWCKRKNHKSRFLIFRSEAPLQLTLSVFLSFCLSVYLSFFHSVCPSVFLSFCLSVCISFILSVCLSLIHSVCLDNVSFSICT